MSKRVLLIAPKLVGIDSNIEAELIGGNYFNVTPLMGEVDRERLTRATVRSHFDVVHIVSHGSPEGIQLSDGMLTMAQLAGTVKDVSAELVYLNSCDSARLGQYLADRGVPITLAYTVDVLDDDAISRAASFYRNAASNDGDYIRAYERSSWKDGTLAIFIGDGNLDRKIQPLYDAMQALQERFDSLHEFVTSNQGLMFKIIAVAIGLIALIAAVSLYFIADASGAFASDAVPAALSQTVPLPTNTNLPGCDNSGGQPKKCDTLTPTPAPTVTPVPTDTPRPTVTDADPTATNTIIATVFTPVSTMQPTASFTVQAPTIQPTVQDTPTNTPTDAPQPTSTDKPVVAPTLVPIDTSTPRPTDTVTRVPTATPSLTSPPRPTDTSTPTLKASDTPMPLPTNTPFPVAVQTAIAEAVEATVTALIPNMCTQVCQ